MGMSPMCTGAGDYFRPSKYPTNQGCCDRYSPHLESVQISGGWRDRLCVIKPLFLYSVLKDSFESAFSKYFEYWCKSVSKLENSKPRASRRTRGGSSRPAWGTWGRGSMIGLVWRHPRGPGRGRRRTTQLSSSGGKNIFLLIYYLYKFFCLNFWIMISVLTLNTSITIMMTMRRETMKNITTIMKMLFMKTLIVVILIMTIITMMTPIFIMLNNDNRIINYNLL